MKIRIVIEAEVAGNMRDLREMEATRQSISHWAVEEFGKANISLKLVDDEEEEDYHPELGRSGLGQD